jgi:hypothetical protein
MTKPSALSQLRDIDEVEPLGPQDRACVDEIRAILAKHDALQRFGLTLLHDHFPVADDEVLVEEIDVVTRTLTSRPEKIDPDERVIETSWRLDDMTGMARCRTVCKSDPVTWTGHSRRHYD